MNNYLQVETCYYCTGYEQTRNNTCGTYTPINDDGLCAWKETINNDIKKYNEGEECLTFPDIVEVLKNSETRK